MTTVEQLFENQPKLISPQTAADLLGFKRGTIYDMYYRPFKYDIRDPGQLFIKTGRPLKVVTDRLKDWLISRSKGGKS